MKEHIYKVKGMHCASCEILIEKKLIDMPNIKSVDASISKSEVTIEYEGERPNIEQLNRIFQQENYKFSDSDKNIDLESRKTKNYRSEKKGASPTLIAFNISLLIIIGFLFLNRSGVASLINVESKSSLFAFFGLGLMAGISSCAALVGGMVLSMAKQWQELYSNERGVYRKLQPHLLFNAGRLVSYGVLGAILGIIGSRFQISFQFTSFLIIAISFLMIILGLQMLGLKAFRKFQFALPKFTTRYIADEENFKGKHMPFFMGALTFFLPCGFTITAQGLALLSGNALQGGLIMFAFALGTAPMLLLIGLSSVKFFSNPRLAERFSKIAGFLVLFFALFNLNTQINVSGFTGFSGFFAGMNRQNQVSQEGLPEIINGKQIVKMEASASRYSPNYIKVRAGTPVRWEITDIGTSGCTNAIISRGLFEGSINLTPGKVSVKEFTPEKPGKYRFSCWMGMVTGIIEVIDASASDSSFAGGRTVQAASKNDDIVPSGASGCGCGGGSGNTCWIN